RRLTALIGDNGSGKTTVLQAMALVLSLATRRTRFPDEFTWHGFMADRVSSLGQTRVQLDVLLDESEITTTKELFDEWRSTLSSDFLQTHHIVPPSDKSEISLVYESGKLQCLQGYEAQNQFLGRYYIKALAKAQPRLREKFSSLGDVFWFDQNRNLGTVMASRRDAIPEEKEPSETWETGVEQLREFLVGWWGYHTSPEKRGGKDYIPELETHFQRVFPATFFRGIMPRESDGNARVSDFYFLMERAGHVFDIAEMSSGEQAVFPLLYEFVRLDIARSIVLIDELELHLHPPQQQALLAALPKIGPDCQFVISTHSSYLEEVIPDEHEVRLEGGRLCL
ncbi:MAG: AAA family ATPase, partial [Candidatus Hydrogenedentes bacterium]|nr:AAA family ATPase [Candidatus Hydrogenedentota bacterium]